MAIFGMHLENAIMESDSQIAINSITGKTKISSYISYLIKDITTVAKNI